MGRGGTWLGGWLIGSQLSMSGHESWVGRCDNWDPGVDVSSLFTCLFPTLSFMFSSISVCM